MDEDTFKFLKEREDRLGAKIQYRTYALFYGASNGEKREYGVFLYTDGDTFIFEDFDRPPRILGIEIKSAKRPKYEKMEHSFKRSEVTGYQIVTRKSAMDVIDMKAKHAKTASAFAKAFQKVLVEISLEERKYYFEIMDEKNLRKIIFGGEN